MTKLKIAVLSGGLSNEREVSLMSGQQVYNNLSAEKYEKYLIEIGADGQWTVKNSDAENKEQKTLNVFDREGGIRTSGLKLFNLCFPVLHGKYGEDGRFQSVLDILGIPYTGSGVLASALAMNKLKTLELMSGGGMKMPKYITYTKNQRPLASEVRAKAAAAFGFPCVVKPSESGSSIGISIVRTPDDLEAALDKAFNEDDTVLVEEYIKGREITCGVLGNTGQTEIVGLPPVEIIAQSEFFDYQAKYFSQETKEICPAELTADETRRVQDLAKQAHALLGCDGLTRSDFILKDNEFYFLETNTLPGMTEASLCPKEAKAAGMSFGEFLDQQVDLAVKKYSIR